MKPFVFVRRFSNDRSAAFVVLRYLSIGGFAQLADVGLFLLFVKLGVTVEVAATGSIVIAAAGHFLLNKYANFRNQDRAMSQQLGTYVIVGLSSLVLQVGVISFSSHVLSASPIVCKIASVLVNTPYGYIAHRYLTFGRGISGAVRHVLSQSANRRASPIVATASEEYPVRS